MRSPEDEIQYALQFDVVEPSEEKVKAGKWSAYIDGKLYKSKENKTVWNKKQHVVNSVKNYSHVSSALRTYFENQLYNEHPNWLGVGAWSHRPFCTAKYRVQFEEEVQKRMDAWMEEHVVYVSGTEDKKKKILDLISEYIDKGDRCMTECERYMDDDPEQKDYFKFWDGFHNCALNLYREIKEML